MFAMFDRLYGINKIKEILKENKFEPNLPNKLVNLVNNVIKVICVFFSIVGILAAFVFVYDFMRGSIAALLLAFIAIFTHFIFLWFFRFLCMDENLCKEISKDYFYIETSVFKRTYNINELDKAKRHADSLCRKCRFLCVLVIDKNGKVAYEARNK